MSDIHTYRFCKEELEKISQYHYSENWPVNYILKSDKEAYVGETTFFKHRMRQHLEKQEKARLEDVHLITDEQFHKSCTLDIESLLIQYMAAENRYILQNGNGGLRSHNYYNKELYQAKFELIWEDLKDMGIVSKTLHELRNSDLFKFSPYKVLTEEQMNFVEYFMDYFEINKDSYLIHGGPGTGKSVLAVYLLKHLVDTQGFTNDDIALVVPMTSLRTTIKSVFKNVQGLSAGMVIGPAEVVRKQYKLLVVDEAHRLKRRKNITNYHSFDTINKQLGFGEEGTELDWILASSERQIFFYDAGQSIRPSDIPRVRFQRMQAVEYRLTEQLRIQAGSEVEAFVASILGEPTKSTFHFPNYDLKLFEDVEKMVAAIRQKNEEHTLCRLVAGYAWDWKSKGDTTGSVHDIEIEGIKLKWNSTTKDWVNAPNSINEVGCIHTIQGYELNYVGVIIGPELSFDKDTQQIVINRKFYKDKNGHRGVFDDEELKPYIINIYRTLLTRGIKGLYLYVVDPLLRTHTRSLMQKVL